MINKLARHAWNNNIINRDRIMVQFKIEELFDFGNNVIMDDNIYLLNNHGTKVNEVPKHVEVVPVEYNNKSAMLKFMYNNKLYLNDICAFKSNKNK